MRPIYVIPAGQVLASFVREVEAMGGIDGIAGAADLFARDADGRQDMIHLNDKGAYLVALTHYAVLHQSSPGRLAARAPTRRRQPGRCPQTRGGASDAGSRLGRRHTLSEDRSSADGGTR